MQVTIGRWSYKVSIATRPDTCTNCSEGIKPGQAMVWKWGGWCHARICSGAPQPTATSSGTSTQHPPKRNPWKWAPTAGHCTRCSEQVEVGQPIIETGNQWIHTRCA